MDETPWGGPHHSWTGPWLRILTSAAGDSGDPGVLLRVSPEMFFKYLIAFVKVSIFFYN